MTTEEKFKKAIDYIKCLQIMTRIEGTHVTIPFNAVCELALTELTQ
jgi:hypothetical protein